MFDEAETEAAPSAPEGLQRGFQLPAQENERRQSGTPKARGKNLSFALFYFNICSYSMLKFG
ncbi:hypothetical protein [Paenibacillus agaridevorans]|uniref:hypothetical protein n=1 Tax=Paenibacillus agaridevorans TaxID=171404 RepID=UPI001BE46D19|nr:hypothetical protein [Paenibacillus agaridevorans]